MLCRFLIIVFSLLLISCGGGEAPRRPPVATAPPAEQPPPPVPEEVVEGIGVFKVGLLLPLTGPGREIGRAFLRSAQMALFDIGDPRLRLLPRDVGATPEQAAEAAQAALDNGAQLLIGPVFRRSVAAAGAVARQANVPLIGFSNDRLVAGGGVYLTGFAPFQEVRRVIDFAIDQGHRKFAALIPETAYGDAVARAFHQAITAHQPAVPAALPAEAGLAEAAGGDAEPDPDPDPDLVELVSVVTYPPSREGLFEPVKLLADYDARRRAYRQEVADLESFGEDDGLAQEMLEKLEPLETLGELPYDAVLVPEGGALLRALAPLLPYYEIDPATIQFLGTALWDDPSVTREPSLIGGWFAAPPTDRRRAFQRRFAGTYGAAPPRLATLGYDAVALAAILGLERAEELRGRPLPARLLESPNGFQGLEGIFRFAPDGMAERGLAVKEITSEGITVISPAPQTFQAIGS